MRFVASLGLAALLLGGQPLPNTAPVIQWRATNGPYGGEARALLVHRNQLLVVAARGAWRSPDRGTSWRSMTGRFVDGWGFTQSGRDLFVHDIRGLHRTATLGRSWTTCGALPRESGSNGPLLPAGDRLLYWVPRVGLFVSRDRCASWTPMAVPWDTGAGLAVFQFVSGTSSLIAITFRGSFRSADHGATWQTITTPPGQPLTSTLDRGSGVLVGTGAGIFRLAEDGRSWKQLAFARRWVRNLLVTPSGEIYASVEHESRTTVMRSLDNGASWSPADAGLSGHLVNGLGRDDAGTVYAATDSGVYRLDRSGRWQHVGLPTFFATSLTAAPWGDLYAAGDSYGLTRSADKGTNWRALLLPREHARTVTVTTRGELLLASPEQVYRSQDRGETWREAGLQRSVWAFLVVPTTGVLLAGTGNGLFRSLDDGETWVERSIGLRSFTVTSFAASADGRVLFAGTVAGEGWGEVYRSTDNGERWRLVAPEFEGGVVEGLAPLRDGGVLAGTREGIFRWIPGNHTWEHVWSRPQRSRVSALAADSRGRILAGTSAAGVFVSEDGGDTWTAANDGLPTLRIRALAGGPQGDVYVATGPPDWNIGIRSAQGPVKVFRGRFVSP